jgi:tetratricopeptide (TPR) repeat protein
MMWRLALIALVLGTMGISLRAAVTARYDADQPARSAWAVPRTGNAMLVLAAQQIVGSDGAVEPPTRALIVDAMARVPAAGQPLALAGLAASAEGDLPRATQLMEAARSRAPRYPLARNWLLNEYVRAARYDEALAEAGALMRLAPETRLQVYALVQRMAERDDAAPAVRRALAGRPDWAESYEAWTRAQGRPDTVT